MLVCPCQRPLLAHGLSALLVLLSAIDAVTTLVLVDRLGIQAELNPIMRAVIAFSPLVFFVAKVVVAACGAAYLERRSRWALHAVTLTYALVCVNNAVGVALTWT